MKMLTTESDDELIFPISPRLSTFHEDSRVLLASFQNLAELNNSESCPIYKTYEVKHLYKQNHRISANGLNSFSPDQEFSTEREISYNCASPLMADTIISMQKSISIPPKSCSYTPINRADIVDDGIIMNDYPGNSPPMQMDLDGHVQNVAGSSTDSSQNSAVAVTFKNPEAEMNQMQENHTEPNETTNLMGNFENVIMISSLHVDRMQMKSGETQLVKPIEKKKTDMYYCCTRKGNLKPNYCSERWCSKCICILIIFALVSLFLSLLLLGYYVERVKRQTNGQGDGSPFIFTYSEDKNMGEKLGNLNKEKATDTYEKSDLTSLISGHLTQQMATRESTLAGNNSSGKENFMFLDDATPEVSEYTRYKLAQTEISASIIRY